MSAATKARDRKIRKAEAELGKLNEELRLDLLQAGIDAAGTVDPTPVSDLTGAAVSVYRGDFIGAGLSLISMIPYVGDAVGKSAKGARLLKKINDLRKRISITANKIVDLQRANRKAASRMSRLRKHRLGSKHSDEMVVCRKCNEKAKAGEFAHNRMPNGGEWNGTPGDSYWRPGTDKYYERKLRVLNERRGLPANHPIEFRNGFPNFEPYASGKVKIDMKGNCLTSSNGDFGKANAAMKKIDPDFDWDEVSKTHTWHHVEDGTTMLLIPKTVNKIPHTGGASLIKEQGY